MGKRAKRNTRFLRPKKPKSETTVVPEDLDRISRFPDEILLAILSRLPIQDAARSSLLSRRWRSLWTLTTTLDIDFAKDVRDLELRLGRPSLGAERRRFVDGLNRILDSHENPVLHRLRICLDARDVKSGSDIDKWVDFAMRKSAQELDLQLVNSAKFDFSFPSLGFSHFNSLKSLSLHHANVTGYHVEYFVSNCPSLEILCLGKLECIENLKISGSSLKLKNLEVSCCFNLKTLDISAPNLVSLKYWGPDVKLTLANVPHLEEVSFLEAYCMYLVKHKFKQFSGVLSQLQTLRLTLNYSWLTEFPKLDGLTNVNRLELNLKVWDFDNPFQLCTSLMKALPFLYKFSLHLFWSVINEPDPESWAPLLENHRHHCLKVVELVGFVGCLLDVKLVEYLVTNAVSLEKMTIHSCRRAWVDSLGDLMTMQEKQHAHGRANALREILSPYSELVLL